MENKELDTNQDIITEDNTSDNQAKWYIVTSITGNEDAVYKNIEDKVRAYNLEHLVQEMRLLKTREITIEVFDPINNPPPSRFRNTKSITWETLPGNRYKKTRIREVNRFPGYIYIKMVMADDAWYIIRNTFGVTGFVGSSGKGAKPIPMSDIEVANLFDPAMNQDIIINKTSDIFVEQTVTKPKEPEKKIEFLEMVNERLVDDEGFFNSNLSKSELEENDSKEDASTTEVKDAVELESSSDDVDNKNLESNLDNQYLSEHDTVVEEVLVDETNSNNEKDSNEVELFHSGNSQNKSPLFAVGNTVEIIAESMKGYDGVIQELDLENNKAKVLVNTLGRETIVEIAFSEMIKKI